MGIVNKSIAITLLATVTLAGCSKDKPEDNTDSLPEPIAQVQTTRLQKSGINETITVYGTVLPWPDKLQSISVPYNSVVDKILVNEGQGVQQGDLLLILKPGADAKLQLEQARKELKAAGHELQLVQERIRLKLAAQPELVAVQLRAGQAKAMLDNLTGRGIGGYQQLKAGQAGVIHVVNVQQGQSVPAGSPLLQLVGQNQWVVRLGIGPEDFGRLKPNQPVLLTPANKPIAQPIKGSIAMITQQIDPTTRLFNVFVKPEPNQQLLINDFVQAKIIVSSAKALTVPR